MDHLVPAVFSFLCLLFMKDVTGIHISITPKNPTETIDTNVQIACTLGQDISKYQEIYIMDIVKDTNKQIAVIRSQGITFKHDEMENRFEAQGIMNGNVAETYLNLTLLLPRVEDSGSYSCVISYLDKGGILQQDKSTATLVVEKVENTNGYYLETVVHSLIRRVETLETLVKQKQQEKQSLQNEKQDLQKVKQNLQTSLNKQKDDLMKKIIALERKVNYKSVFSATLKAKNARTSLSPSMGIIFDDVIQRQGQGYDETSGVFTAKMKGLYAFHLTMGTWSKRSSLTNVDLTLNGQAKARLQTTNYNSNNGGNQDQAEISLVTVLNAGDKVQAVSGPNTTKDEQMIGSLCSFSGYLVRHYD